MRVFRIALAGGLLLLPEALPQPVLTIDDAVAFAMKANRRVQISWAAKLSTPSASRFPQGVLSTYPGTVPFRPKRQNQHPREKSVPAKARHRSFGPRSLHQIAQTQTQIASAEANVI